MEPIKDLGKGERSDFILLFEFLGIWNYWEIKIFHFILLIWKFADNQCFGQMFRGKLLYSNMSYLIHF